MALKKSQLYSHIWEACDELRGSMDASQYKDYVLVLLFVRYVSDKYANEKRADVVIPAGGSFNDLISLKGKKDIGDGINTVLRKLAAANGLTNIIDAVDFNDDDKLGAGKEKQDRLTKLISIFEDKDLDFSKNRADGDDLLGDAYEYLMKHFASQSGKSKGQFYTPAEVSRIIARVIGVKNAPDKRQTVYDPACGSGSLLLKVSAEAPNGVTMFGQEFDNATGTLATINMWVHGEPTADIQKGASTLSSPRFLEKDNSLKTFDYVVANPPFSYKAWRSGFDPEHDPYKRFEGFGIPPTKNGDYAFLLHIIKSLKSTGKGAVVLPHGVLFRSNAEGQIRENLVKRGYIKGIIGLPANLFYGTGIPACILVIDKENAANSKGIFMIDASKGFVKDGNKNRLREQDIKKIVDTFTKQLEIPKFSRFVPTEEISDAKNAYNLNLPRYIDSAEVEDIQDIDAHLKGGIPDTDIEALAPYWQVCPSLKKSIFKDGTRKGYSDLRVAIDDVRGIVLEHEEFAAFRTSTLKTFGAWRKDVTETLKTLSSKDHPKVVIQEIADKLLTTCAKLPLVDKYDVYQHLMNYWGETMQDDSYIVVADGWKSGNEWVRLQNNKEKDIAGLKGLEGKLIPVSLLIRTRFEEEQNDINDLNTELEQILAEMESMKEEHGGEDGLLSEVIDNDKITKGRVQARLKLITKDPSQAEDGEHEVLSSYASLLEREASAKTALKNAENDLENKVLAMYPRLTVDEIKTLVVEQKWMDVIEGLVVAEVDRLSHTLAGRVQELASRYAETLPHIEHEVEELSKKVDAHLKKMGFVWK